MKCSKAERLYREGKLPKRVCHCDTKVNNMMFDEDGKVLCVIDLDTVMPSFIFSDYGDFLRTGANTGDEDDKNLDNVNFNMEIFKAFTKGYLEGAGSFLTPDRNREPALCSRSLPLHAMCTLLRQTISTAILTIRSSIPNTTSVRTKAQFKLLQSVEEHTPRNGGIHQRVSGINFPSFRGKLLNGGETVSVFPPFLPYIPELSK